jgi:hypothetical protein
MHEPFSATKLVERARSLVTPPSFELYGDSGLLDQIT